MYLIKRRTITRHTTIIKSAPISDEEACLLQPNQAVISPIHMPLPLKKPELLEQLIAKKIIAIAFDSIKDDAGTYPIVRSMSEIAGSFAITIAAKYLGNTDHGKGVLLGGISGVPPARVLIVGAGLVSEFAAPCRVWP